MGQIASSVSSGMKKTMDENFKRQMDFQIENFQLQLERQLVLQVQIFCAKYDCLQQNIVLDLMLVVHQM